nr:MAG TPA: hypothetical protein [Caudoviricetes sp.]
MKTGLFLKNISKSTLLKYVFYKVKLCILTHC